MLSQVALGLGERGQLGVRKERLSIDSHTIEHFFGACRLFAWLRVKM